MKLAFDNISILRSAVCLTLLVGGMVASIARADETEVFRSSNENSNARPKVLIIFDNSGSMNDVVPNSRPAYDPAITYPTVPGISSDRLYWSVSSDGNPPTLTQAATQNFEVSKNRCASSEERLRLDGAYTSDRFMMIRPQNNQNSRTWERLDVSSNTIEHYDCVGDITSGNSGNLTLSTAGFPRDNNPRTGSYGPTAQTGLGAGFRVTRIYSANYMNWRLSPTLRDLRRIEIARNVISGIVNTNPQIDFGLAVFNRNVNGNNGGRIVRRIIENMTPTDRTGLVNIINGLQPLTNTPLCETMFEVYRYFSDGDMLYGLQKAANVGDDGPPRDKAAERTVDKDYLSPVGDCQNVYVILMTDGEPTQDTDANGRIKTLTGKTTCRTYSGAENCMPELAEYMFTQDIDGITTNGVQRAITYTIGFTTNQALLAETATRGGGQYYTAGDTDELTSAFQGAINTILEVNASFTSPAVAVDSFTRTESRNEVFYAMFRPTEGTNWPGNIKKLRVQVSTDGSARLVDQAGQSAIDATSGFIRDQATTFWGSTADGPSVQAGGVGERLLTKGPANRRILTNTGTNGALQAFNATNINRGAYSFTTDTPLFSLYGVANQTELNDLLAWSRGHTDASATATRPWILGDIIHSRPLVLNYGIRSTAAGAPTDPDLRVVVGTNAGFVHMFNNANGDEDWAFFPKELAPVLKPRKDDLKDGNKVWGVDGPIVAYRFDANQDGNIRSGGDDRMIIFFGLRRGGRALYAMDVTDPDNPTFLWRISNATAGFEELGETWSVPVVTSIPGYRDASGRVLPVLVLGGGYDKVNDDKAETAATTPDIMGRGIFIVDALTGAKVWSVTPAVNSTNNKQETRFVHAMPAPPAVIDSNGDGITDRIYIPDLGGNVWRIDMPGNILPNTVERQSLWRVTQLARLADTGAANDRRFMSEVDVVRTTYKGRSFDAVQLGSGDRTNPKAVDNNDRFYMLRDYQITPYVSDPPTFAQCTAVTNPSTDNRCRLPITEASLYDASQNLIQVGTQTQINGARTDLAAAMGWFLQLGASAGEKSLSASTTLRGITFFSTFAPSTASVTRNACVPQAGTARLYALNLQDGSAAIDFNGNGALVTNDRFALLGSSVPDTPSLYFSRDQQIRLLFPAGGGPTQGTQGTGGNCGPGMLCGPRGLRPVVPTYRYEREF